MSFISPIKRNFGAPEAFGNEDDLKIIANDFEKDAPSLPSLPDSSLDIEFKICPPTPHKRGRLELNHPSFSKGELATEVDTQPLPIEYPSRFNLTKVYSRSGVKHTVMKQQSSKDCGGTALLMLFTDLFRKKGSDFSLNSSFWEEYHTCSQADANGLQTAAKKMNGHFDIQILSNLGTKNALYCIKTKIQQTGLPVISSITHQGTNWIIVDAVGEKESYIRDPKTGNAYCIPNDEMTQFYKSGIEKCLFVKA